MYVSQLEAAQSGRVWRRRVMVSTLWGLWGAASRGSSMWCAGSGTDIAHNWRGDWEIVGLEVNFGQSVSRYSARP